MTPVLKEISIAFDLDGTLIDSAPDLIACLYQTLEQESPEDKQKKKKPIPYAQIRPYAGKGVAYLFETLYAHLDITISPTHKQKHIECFLKLYAQQLHQRSTVFPGAIETLKTLSSYGARLSVCTNKPFSFTCELLKKFKLSHFFERIITPEQTQTQKPDARHLQQAVSSASPKKSVLIGDTDIDVKTAKSYGALAVIMKHGYWPDPNPDISADLVLDHFSSLAPHLKTLFS